MDEAARLRIIIEALGLRATQRGLRQLQRDLGMSGQSADRFSRDIARSTRRSIGDLGRLSRAASFGGIAGLAVGFGAATRAGFKFNAAMESNELAMRRFVGSTKETRRYLNDLLQIAKRTPFEFTDLTAASRKMMAFGLSANQTRKTLSALGDAIAAAGGGREQIESVTRAFGQVQAKGKVYAEELLQFTEAGIPAFRILKQELGLTDKQMKDIGKSGISSGVAIRALTQGMNRRFSGAAKEQSRTWNGLMSTVKDTWAQTTGAMTAGLFREARKWAPTVINTMGQIGRIFRRRDLNFGEKLKLSGGVLQRNIIDPIRRKLSELQIGDKLAGAFERAIPRVLDAMVRLGGRAAGAFVRAWAEAGAWTHFLSMAFVAHKLGVFSAFGRRAGRRFTNNFETTTAAGLTAATSRKGRIGGAAASLGKSIGITMAIAAGIEFGTRFSGEIASALSAAGDWIKGAVGNLGEAFGEVLPKGPQQRRAERAGRLSIGRGGAGLGGGPLGGFPKRWNNPNEGGAMMGNPFRRARRKTGDRIRDLRLRRSATNTRIQERADAIDFQLGMGRITMGAAADQLDALAQGVKNNKRLRRQLLLSAHQLRSQAGEEARQQVEQDRQDHRERVRRAKARERSERRRFISERNAARRQHRSEVNAAKSRGRRRDSGDRFQLNLEGARIPTVYEVKRSRILAGKAGPSVVGSSAQPTTIIQGGVNITIEGAGKHAREIAEETMRIVHQRERTAGAAARRARGGKRKRA